MRGRPPRPPSHGGPGPGPGPGADDVQRGGRGHREGGGAAPPHASALPALPDIERYSDKYQICSPVDSAIDWNPDWRRLPRELKIRVRRLRKNRATVLVPRCKQQVALDKEETIKRLESLEKKEEEVTSEEEEEKEEEEEGKEEEEEEYDEEEHEEETDYIMSYFDNGEDFGADSDDNMDEAVY
ncbi:DNA-directed RNA polymerase III subunit RPC7-like isoform 3-T3 [Amazona ochrocephala]